MKSKQHEFYLQTEAIYANYNPTVTDQTALIECHLVVRGEQHFKH